MRGHELVGDLCVRLLLDTCETCGLFISKGRDYYRLL